MLVQAHREPALHGKHVMGVAPLNGSVHHRLVCTRLCLCACVLVSFASTSDGWTGDSQRSLGAQCMATRRELISVVLASAVLLR